MNIYSEDVVIPENGSKLFWAKEIETIYEGETLIGNDCIFGVRVWRDHDRLLFFPRICMHAGAPLDNAQIDMGKLACPWHGKMIEPFAEIKDGEVVNLQDSSRIQVFLEGNQVIVESKKIS